MSNTINLDEILKPEEVEEIIAQGVRDGVSKSIEKAFSWNGALHEALSKQVEQALVPAIENYDFSKYVVKLDETLSQIIESTALVDNKRILSNFKRLMAEPPKEVITFEELFRAYCGFVEDTVDTSGLEVDTDDEPTYQCVHAMAEIERIEKPLFATSRREEAKLYFRVEEDDSISYEANLNRWSFDRAEGYEIRFDQSPDVSKLRYASEFEVLLMQLSRAGVRLKFDDENLEDYVQPSKQPECEWV